MHRIAISIALVFPAVAAAATTHIEAYYTGEVLYNANGGLRTGSAYLDDAGLTVETAFDSATGSAAGTFFVYFLYNNGTTFSPDFVGDIQGISNIDAIEALRIYEFWYEQPLADTVSLRFGLYDLNSEFDSIETPGLFVNSSHGIGADFAQSGVNGPSIFPVTSLAARLSWNVGGGNTLRYALLDGVPGDPDHPSRTAIKLGGDDGGLHVLEYNHQFPSGMRAGLGTWLYTADFAVIDADNPSAGPSRDDGNNGAYGFVELPVYSSATSGARIDAFLRYGIADDTFNTLDSYLGAGVVATGLLPGRADDKLGFALARASLGSPARQALAADGTATESFELNLELTYSAQVSDWLRLQPNIQYVINPGADPSLDDALVIGFRFEMSTSPKAISHEWP